MEVPLENQTKECLIAYIESLESQSKHDEKRRAALEELAKTAKTTCDRNWERLRPAVHDTQLQNWLDHLIRDIAVLDALTPKEKP